MSVKQFNNRLVPCVTNEVGCTGIYKLTIGVNPLTFGLVVYKPIYLVDSFKPCSCHVSHVSYGVFISVRELHWVH